MKVFTLILALILLAVAAITMANDVRPVIVGTILISFWISLIISMCIPKKE